MIFLSESHGQVYIQALVELDTFITFNGDRLCIVLVTNEEWDLNPDS